MPHDIDAAADFAFPFIAARLFNTPLMITDDKIDTILSAIGPRLGVSMAGAPASPFLNTAARQERKRLAVMMGVGVIDVQGTLVHETNGLHPFSGMTPYQSIMADAETGENDPGVRAHLFRIHSPGGEANGVFSAADYIRKLKKPTACIISDVGCSAAYMIAAACKRVFITDNAQVGSIGVIARHIDREKMNDMIGVKITNMFRGARKGDHVEPLTEESTANIMRMIESMYDLFCGKVSTFRGLSVERIKAQESRIFHGVAAIDEGLADEVKSESEALAWLSENAANPAAFTVNAKHEGNDMNLRNKLMTGAALVFAPEGQSGGAQPAPPAPKAEDAPADPNAPKKPEEETEEVKKAKAAEAAALAAGAKVTAEAAAFASANPSAHAAIAAAAATAERERIVAIRKLCQAGEEAIAEAFIAEGVTAADAGVALAEHRKKTKGAQLAITIAERAAPIPAAPSAQGGPQTVKEVVGDPLSDANLEAAFKADAAAQRDFGDGEKGLNAYKAWARLDARQKSKSA